MKTLFKSILKFSLSIPLLTCLTFVTNTSFATSFAIQSKVVAVVNGEMISSLDLETRIQPILIQKKIESNDTASIHHVRKEVLDQMVQEQILLQAAAAAGINISNAYLEHELNARIQSSQMDKETFLKHAKDSGLDEDAIKDDIKRSLAIGQLINSNVTTKVVITNKDIEEYYNKYQNLFNNMPEYHFALIIYENEADANKYSAMIKNNEMTFSQVAKSFSVGPNPENGGELGTMKGEDIAPDLLYVLQNLQEGESSSLIDMAYSKAQIHLIDKAISSKTGQLDEATRNQIIAVLREPLIKTRYEEYIAELNKKALIDIRYE